MNIRNNYPLRMVVIIIHHSSWWKQKLAKSRTPFLIKCYIATHIIHKNLSGPVYFFFFFFNLVHLSKDDKPPTHIRKTPPRCPILFSLLEIGIYFPAIHSLCKNPINSTFCLSPYGPHHIPFFPPHLICTPSISSTRTHLSLSDIHNLELFP